MPSSSVNVFALKTALHRVPCAQCDEAKTKTVSFKKDKDDATFCGQMFPGVSPGISGMTINFSTQRWSQLSNALPEVSNSPQVIE